jgi:GMP synthase-like glutamine amidotransferase
MRALVIQHDHVSPPGPVSDQLERRLYDVVEHQVVPEESFHSPGVPADFPDPRDFDLLVLMGAPWSVYDRELIGSWVVPELQLAREADEAGVPTLGICFGGQVLAAAHGGIVERSPMPELGWVDIETDRAALVPPGPWFQWHFDRWWLPSGATEVARNPAASQAFVLRRNLAVQFHPELTPAMLQGWLGNGGQQQLESLGVDVASVVEATDREAAAAEARTHALVDAFVDHFCSSRPARPRNDLV